MKLVNRTLEAFANHLDNGNPYCMDFSAQAKRALESDNTDEMYGTLYEIYYNRNLILTRAGVLGHRFSDSTQEWVCDPLTQLFKDVFEMMKNDLALRYFIPRRGVFS